MKGSEAMRSLPSGLRHPDCSSPTVLAPNTVPRFRDGFEDIQLLFERILDQTFGVSEGIWIGTPVNLNREWESKELERRMAEIRHPHLVLWGERDGWIPPADLRAMAAAMPDCRLVIVPGVGHSMNLKNPALYAGYFDYRGSRIAIDSNCMRTTS